MKPTGSSGFYCVRCGNREGVPETQKVSSIQDCFPYRAMRGSQAGILKSIETDLDSKRFIIIEAPVGSGKSAIAATLSSFLGSAHIVVATKQLQDQYASDFGYPVIKGKGNFQCYVPTSTKRLLPCNKGRCQVDWSLKECPHYITYDEHRTHERGLCTESSSCEKLKGGNLCTYYKQKWYGFDAPVTVYNYPLLLSELKYPNDVPKRKLLVCDEAHELERQLVAFAAFHLKKNDLEAYHDELWPEEDFIIPYMGEEDPSAWLDELEKISQMLKSYLELHQEADEVQDRVAVCKSRFEDLERFIGSLRDDEANWIVNNVKLERQGSVEEVVFQPLSVKNHTSELYKSADRIIMMSATIFSIERFCDSLGIPEEETAFIRVEDSAFPVESRPIYSLNTAYLSKANLDASLQDIVLAVNKIMNIHEGERGVIHTTSYFQARHIQRNISEKNRKRIVTTEGTFDRSILLQIHGSNKDSVLISPSLYEGVDLKDDLSRFQIIVKVPFPDLSERRTRILMEKDQAWYELQTAQRLVQTYGRSVRNETDHAVTYVLDSNFTRFVRAHKSLFPKYLLEAIRAEGLPQAG